MDQGRFSDPDFISGTHQRENVQFAYDLNYCYSGGRQGKLPNTALECYDFTEDKWEKLPDIPSKRVFAMYTTTDKFIFSLGGLKQPATDGFSDACEVFDTEKSKYNVQWNLCNPTPEFPTSCNILEKFMVPKYFCVN